MYAIIETGGKQYRVEKGDVIDVELLGKSEGKVQFEKVLFLHDGKVAKVGKPSVQGCVVEGELVQEVKGPKVSIFKYERRKNYSLRKGHRQKYSQVKITGIKG